MRNSNDWPVTAPQLATTLYTAVGIASQKDQMVLITSTPGLSVVEGVHHRIGVRSRNGCRDLFRVQFQNKFIFIHFPYQPNAEGIVNRIEFPVGSTHTFNVTDEAYGMACKIKYNHPIDGKTHFSQAGGIKTVVRNQANRLDSSTGHFFTLDISGVSLFRSCKGSGDVPGIQFLFDREAPVDSLHIFGHWIKLENGQRPGDLTNPIIVELVDGPRQAIAVAPPLNSPLYPGIIAIFAQPGSSDLALNPDDFRLIFLGGFAKDLGDRAVPSSFIAMLYPADISALGNIDYLRGDR
jgi:hypothetical protein